MADAQLHKALQCQRVRLFTEERTGALREVTLIRREEAVARHEEEVTRREDALPQKALITKLEQ